MIRNLILALTVTLGANAQVTNFELFKQLQQAVDLPVLTKATHPNRAYEARLFMKAGNQVGIIVVVSETGVKQFFSMNTATNEANSISGVKLKSNGLAAIFNQEHYQFVCSYGFHVVD